MSSLNLNKVILAGHIADTPELKQTTSGIAVCQIRLMVNRRKAADGTQAVDGFNIVCWRSTAEFVCRYFKKGSAICVVGTLQERTYTTASNEKRYVTEVVADEVMFVDSVNGQESRENHAGDANTQKATNSAPKQQNAENGQKQAPLQAQEKAQTQASPVSQFQDDDDLPF